jgi:gamma-glutamylaminecyclotransferase
VIFSQQNAQPMPDETTSGHGPSEVLFVYGTLRRGGPSHTLLGAASFVAEATVRGCLYHFGAYPALRPLGETEVHGELWRCDAETLRRLDSYEGVEEGLFRRVSLRSSGGECWAYVAGPRLRLEEATPLDSGRWPD